MLQVIRKSRFAKFIAVFMAFNMVFDIFIPNVAKALTGGPSQPEVQSFEPIGTSEMVDLVSGDFNYNIPLMDVDGYPLNISYHSGVSMDQEASWVGLGWNLNVGTINRNMRGMPDDFNGDQVVKEMNMKPNRTFGAKAGLNVDAEIFGFKAITLDMSYTGTYNNYSGVGYEKSLSININSGKAASGPLSGSLGISSGTNGLSIRPSVSFSASTDKLEGHDTQLKSTIGTSFNSRTGLKSLDFNTSLSITESKPEGARTAKNTYNGSTSTSISFGTPTYVPKSGNAMTNTSVNVSAKLGGEIFGTAVNAAVVSGFYSEQRLSEKSSVLPAFGYINSHLGQKVDNVLLDFNRENDVPYSLNTPALPVTNFTYDLYSVCGQGISGMYRPYRSDVGYVYDSEVSTTSDSYTVGADFAGGNVSKGGADVGVTDVTTRTKPWLDGNEIASSLEFKSSGDDKFYEPSYFKQVGEKSADDNPEFFEDFGEYDPIRAELGSSGMDVTTKNNLKRQTSPFPFDEADIPVSGGFKNYRTKRNKRNQPITTLTLAEAQNFGLQKNLYTGGGRVVSNSAKDYHIAEITTLKPDGSRYVFGIPAYNTKQKEVSFNAAGLSTDCNAGTLTYNPGVDNSIGNSRGRDNYFNSVELPAYAHSYLLTAVLSADYIDRTGDGPTNDDFGTYTKFNYDKTSSYKWRTPYGSNKANTNEALKTKDEDNQGNYVYGDKELYYLASIESKNYIAVFDTEDRKDGLGVDNENGAISSPSKMQLLKRISLYTQMDYSLSNYNNVAPTPIKQVYFLYDYSLCQTGIKVPNNPSVGTSQDWETTTNQQGKLTLKKLYFTYGTSKKAKLSPYEFIYADAAHDGTSDAALNPAYNLKGYDRWGNYKPNTATSCVATSTDLPTSEYPYVLQDKDSADKYTAAWSLSTIKLPSGGSINIDYESDDYGYVQDKQAMQMFKITKIGHDTTDIYDVLCPELVNPEPSGSVNQLMKDLISFSPNRNNNYLYFKLQKPIPYALGAGPAKDSLEEYYLKGINELYFRFLVNMHRSGRLNPQEAYEYVSGYAGFNDFGLVDPDADTDAETDYNYAYIELKEVSIGDKSNTGSVNPIAKAAWQFGRMNLPEVINDSPIIDVNSSIEQVVTKLATNNIYSNIAEAFLGPNRIIRNKDYGKEARIGKSWIRLNSPYKSKLGGGCRVKKLTIQDNWYNLEGAQASSAYGQTYSYTTLDEFTGSSISSGVASYEPGIGGDENPFKTPIPYGDIEENWLAPDDSHYLENPIGESFFPSPSIGYSRVTVKNLSYTGVKRHATGYVVHEFYTGKDFPTITKRSIMDAKPKKTKPILKLLKMKAKDYMTVSQGFVVELNDMHGKPKGMSVYAEAQTKPISKVEYIYKTDATNKKRLSNTITSIDKAGALHTQTVGVDFDCVADMREQETKINSTALQGNLDVFIVAFVPTVIPTALPSGSKEETRFRSVAITKVINRYGILDKTIATDAGSVVSTENIGYDHETGEVLLTKTKNDFEDALYSFTYPAHWGYDRMGPAYKNIGCSFPSTAFTSGAGSITDAEDYFVKGDELAIGSSRYWVCSVGTGTINIINDAGNAPTVTGAVKIIRSGRKNQQSNSIGSVVTLTNPLDNDNNDTLDTYLAFNDVLKTDVAQFSETWQRVYSDPNAVTTECVCTATDEAEALRDFINALAYNDTLMNQNDLVVYDVSPTPTYRFGFTSVLNTSPYTIDVLWSSTDTGKVLYGEIKIGDTPCSVNIELPFPYTWENLNTSTFQLINIYPGIVEDCGESPQATRSFFADAIVKIGSVYVNLTVHGTTTCWDLANCELINTNSSCTIGNGDPVNPYLWALRGNWRKKKAYAFLGSRTQTNVSNNTDIRRDGTYSSFSPYWQSDSMRDWTEHTTNWTYVSEVSKYNPASGTEVETKDALGRYSSALYGFKGTLPVAVASNAKYNEIAFNGFEGDNGWLSGRGTGCEPPHFESPNTYFDRSKEKVHSGKYSLKVSQYSAPMGDYKAIITNPLTTSACTSGTKTCPYALDCSDNLGIFSPETYNGDKKYVISYWVLETGNTPPVFTYTNNSVQVLLNGTPVTLTDVKKSILIDEWQHVQATFIIPNGQTGNISVVMNNLNHSNTGDAYFDDLRIHPYNSNMKSFVYNPFTLRYMASLDENNYATFYEYNEEGTLVRVKKETERGIMTIKENKQHTHHN